jgi:alpha-L-fucosidase
VIKNAGFRQVILTAKHHDGFCLWPSAYTTHSVKYSPWKGGQGDVVAELTQAAHAAGIKVGLYLSPWDRHERTFGSSDADVARLGEFAAALDGTYRVNLASGQAASASADSIFLDSPGCAAAMAVDGKLETFWAAAKGSTKGRLEIDLGASTDFNLVSVREPIELGERATAYHIEVEQSGAWETIASGKVIGQRNLLQVGSRKARRIALVIEGARDVPAIAELAVHQTDYSGTFASGSLLAHKPVTVSNVHPSGTAYGGDKALDDDQQTRWATANGTTAAWLEVDMQSARTIGRLELYEYAPRISGFQLQYRVSPSDSWQVAYEGENAGTAFKTAFGPVSARYVRLNITGATDPPTLWEIRVFPP